MKVKECPFHMTNFTEDFCDKCGRCLEKGLRKNKRLQKIGARGGRAKKEKWEGEY